MFKQAFLLFSLFTPILSQTLIDENDIWNHFTVFQKRFQKVYTTIEDFETRFFIFKTNLYTIFRHNENHTHTFKMGINQFTDLTSYEFQELYLSGYKPMNRNKGSFGCKPFSNNNTNTNTNPKNLIPDSIDWTTKNVVNPVRDQGQCGSCWAFATTANAESVWAIATSQKQDQTQLLDLSEQYLVDCATGIGYFNMGCNGGEPDSAFKYMINNAEYYETDYPYTATTGTCKTKSKKIQPASPKFSTCYDITPNDQIALKAATAKNPVVVAIEADTRYFQSYSSGILTDSIKCGTNLDHAVEIVGYGRENNIDYWKVRNSWSDTWGENGYIRIQRSESINDPGVCGIAMEASFISV
jgi:C1A family cysteine protease